MVIHEYPTIAIDDFRRKSELPPPELCFLTHMHEDHTAGLARKSYYGPIVYCTAATKALLLNYRTRSGAGELKYEHLRQEVSGKEIVKALELDTPYEFELLSGQSLQVTLLDANHCPGNAMILIQPRAGEGDAVLFTGDFKCENIHLSSLKRSPALKPFMPGHGQKSLSLYVDDTFLAHADSFKVYIENQAGLRDLVSLLETYPKRVHFCIGDRVTGHEEVLISLAEKLDTKIHMDAYYYGLYKLIANESPLAHKLLGYCTTVLDDKETRLHFCQKNMSCLYREPNAPMAYFKPCNQPTQKVVDLQNARHAANAVPPGIMALFDETDSVYQGPDQRYYFDKETKTFFPLFPWFYFSRHASYHEVCALRDMLNTTMVRSLEGGVIPCLAPATVSAFKGTGPTTSVVAHEVCQTKRVRSLEGGLVENDAALPIVAKKSRMVPFHDRVRLQKRRERANKKRDQETEDESSLTDSEDEEDRHDAMMLLGQWTAAAPDPHRPVNVQELGAAKPVTVRDNETAIIHESCSVEESICSVRAINSETDSQSGTAAKPSLESRHLYLSAARCIRANKPSESLPRQDDWAAESRTTCAPSSSSLDNDYVDETLDDLKEAGLVSLVARLRENPSCWFDFRFDFVKNRIN